MRLILYEELVDKFLKYLLPYILVDYKDNNFVRDSKDQKLIIGYYFFCFLN